MFNIISDDKILFAREAFKNLGNVTVCKGTGLTAADLKCIDILIIRSGTTVDHALLDGTPVQLVATATTGTDHVDEAYLEEKEISFYSAPGCNAESVVEYVIAAMLSLSRKKNEALQGKTIGIIGAGNIGGRLARRLQALQLHILVNDPPLYERVDPEQEPFEVVPLEALLRRADIITVHTPKVRDGRHPTYHLIDETSLRQMQSGAWLINASRGSVVSNLGLKNVLRTGHLGAVALDVWENEPGIDLELMKMVDIATAHIAGHSYEGKVNGTIQIYEAITAHYGLEGGWNPQDILKPGPEDRLQLTYDESADTFEEGLRGLVMQMYDIEADDRLFRQAIWMEENEKREYFLRLRREYPRRRSFRMHTLNGSRFSKLERQMLEEGLGIKVV